jgi:hypothetical protein
LPCASPPACNRDARRRRSERRRRRCLRVPPPRSLKCVLVCSCWPQPVVRHEPNPLDAARSLPPSHLRATSARSHGIPLAANYDRYHSPNPKPQTPFIPQAPNLFQTPSPLPCTLLPPLPGTCWTDAACNRSLIVSHGGDWNLVAPYDSLAAFERAFDKGADCVKGDFRVAQDDVGVVAHSSPILCGERLFLQLKTVTCWQVLRVTRV